MAFLFVKELTTTSGDTLEDGEGVEASLLGCPEIPPDLCSKFTLEAADSGGEGVGEVLPGLLKTPPNPPIPGLYPGDSRDVCESS